MLFPLFLTCLFSLSSIPHTEWCATVLYLFEDVFFLLLPSSVRRSRRHLHRPLLDITSLILFLSPLTPTTFETASARRGLFSPHSRVPAELGKPQTSSVLRELVSNKPRVCADVSSAAEVSGSPAPMAQIFPVYASSGDGVRGSAQIVCPPGQTSGADTPAGHVPRPRNFTIANQLASEGSLADSHRLSSPEDSDLRAEHAGGGAGDDGSGRGLRTLFDELAQELIGGVGKGTNRELPGAWIDNIGAAK